MSSTPTRPRSPGAGGAAEPEGPRDVRAGLASLFELPGQAVRTVARSSKTTPGRLSLIMVGLIALTLLVGLISTIMAQTKRDTVIELAEQREPLAAAAQQVYRALSDADATAANAFLGTGAEPRNLRERYENNIAQAGASLARAASGATSPAESAQIDVISQQLPVYTGLVETARASNRQGFPVGASYLRQASELMRAKILPAAEQLYRTDTERVREAQSSAKSFPWLTTLLVLGLLAALVATQRYLQRKTNRVLNLGLVLATVAVLFGVLWTSVALITQSVLVSAGQRDGTEQVDVLVESRIAALKARADETLTLVARGDGGAYEEEFVRLTSELAGQDGRGGVLRELRESANDGPAAAHLDRARSSAVAWLAAHERIRQLDDEGSHAEAVELATDLDAEDSAATAFATLDSSLREAITVGRQSFYDDTTNASRALTLLAPGLATLSVIAALGIAVGVRERLREYR